MKSHVFDMKKYSSLLLLVFLINTAMAQDKYEREYRIRKSQFPDKAFVFLNTYLEDAKRLRYYKELDSAKTSYEAKFKKDRLFYSIEFDEEGLLEDVEILVSEVDIPNSSFKAMQDYLKSSFKKYRIRKIQQQYTLTAFETVENTLKKAFQNLIDPKINYELIVAGKKDRDFQDYEILFDSNGKFIRLRKSLPANYDHVLY